MLMPLALIAFVANAPNPAPLQANPAFEERYTQTTLHTLAKMPAQEDLETFLRTPEAKSLLGAQAAAMRADLENLDGDAPEDARAVVVTPMRQLNPRGVYLALSASLVRRDLFRVSSTGKQGRLSEGYGGSEVASAEEWQRDPRLLHIHRSGMSAPRRTGTCQFDEEIALRYSHDGRLQHAFLNRDEDCGWSTTTTQSAYVFTWIGARISKIVLVSTNGNYHPWGTSYERVCPKDGCKDEAVATQGLID